MILIRYFMLLLLSILFGSCIETRVRLYVEVDNSCETCCKNVEFSVYINNNEQSRIRVGDRILIEKTVSTLTTLTVAMVDNNNVTTCKQCIIPQINNQLDYNLSNYTSLTDFDAGQNIVNDLYVYYNTVFFENEDLNIMVKCTINIGSQS